MILKGLINIIKMKKISVIVPVYNVEQYLRRCLDSLVNQTLNDIEIIVVNDGSPDDSQAIIDEYACKYENIRAFKKANGGLSDARNFGLEYVTGEYVAFVDSDDYVQKDMYEKMYSKAKENDFDMVVCNLSYVYPGKLMEVNSHIENDTTDIKKSMINIYPAAWNKLYKRNLFDHDVRFKKGVWFEDVEFLYRLLPYVKSIGVVKEPFYQYVQREGSITSTVNKKIYDYISNWNGIIDYYKEHDLFDEYKEELEYCYVRYIYATFVKQASRYDYADYLDAVDIAIENVNKQFPDYWKNKLFKSNIKGIYLLLFNKTIAKMYYKLRS